MKETDILYMAAIQQGIINRSIFLAGRVIPLEAMAVRKIYETVMA